MKEFQLTGVWWVPENPSIQLQGTLNFSPKNGNVLELLGTFIDHDAAQTALKADIILGFTADGQKVTLVDSYEIHKFGSQRALKTLTFYSQFALVGEHFQRIEDIKFSRMLLNYTNLSKWIDITGFSVETSNEEKSQEQFKEYQVTYRFPTNSPKVKINNTEISFKFLFNADHNDVQTEFSLRQITFICVKPDHEMHFSFYLNNIFYYIESFLTVGMGNTVLPLSMNAMNKDTNISIHCKINNPSNFTLDLNPLSMLFTYKEIEEHFETSLQNWFKKATMLKPSYELFLGTIYSPSMYTEHLFLSYLQSIEAYHRRKIGGQLTPEEEHQKMLDKMLTDIEQKNKHKGQKLKVHISNEMTLRERLYQIITEDKALTDIIIPDRKTFLQDVKQTRNYLIHMDENLVDKTKKGLQLYKLSQRLRFLLEYCFLKEIEFPRPLIKELIQKSLAYRYQILNY